MSDEKEEISLSDPNHPMNLEENARQYFKNAESFRKRHQQRSMREAYEKALELGRASGTPDGCAIAAEASLYLGHIFKTRDLWGMAIERYEETVALAHKSGTPEGLYAGARAAWNLGNTYEEMGMDIGRTSEETIILLEKAFRDAIKMGRDSGIPDALEAAAKAAFNLAMNLESRPAEEVAAVWRQAIELGKASGTPDGRHVAERAEYYLSELLKESSD